MTEPASQADEPILLREDRDAVAVLTLNRPRARNALSSELLSALEAVLDDLAQDQSVKVVVIQARGPAFSAGHDLKELHRERAACDPVFEQCSRMMLAITRLPQPVIAKVHGIATAAGCQLVAACDLAIAARRAAFATPGVNIGLFCSTPAVAVGRAVGRKAAMEMLLTGDMVSAEKAVAIGLINRVVDDEALDSEVDALADKIAARSRVALTLGKETFYRQLELGIEAAYADASQAMARNMRSDDAAEGIGAFLEKRPPKWTDR